MQTLIPIFLLIVLGALLRYFSFPNPEFWPPATRITYYLFLPALLISKVAATQFSGMETIWAITIVLAANGMATILLLGSNRWLGYSGPVITSVLQGGIRVNTYVGLATAVALLGSEGLALAGLVHGIWILTVNAICVGALVVYCGEGRMHQGGQRDGRSTVELAAGRLAIGGLATGVAQSIGPLAKNPMILACGLGLLLSLSGTSLPGWLAGALAILGQAALPLGLLLVGAGLRIAPIRQLGFPVLVSSVAKLLIMPLLVWVLSMFIPIGPLAAAVLVLVASLPSAASSYILAQEMGGDSELMAGILTVETMLAMVTMPLMLWLTA